MVSYTIDVTAARLGAAFLPASSPWTIAAAPGADHALGRSRVLTAGRVDERRAAFRSTPAQARVLIQADQLPAPQMPSVAPMAAELIPSTETISVNVTRKPNFVHTTRITAGGYGGLGPHPERERLA